MPILCWLLVGQVCGWLVTMFPQPLRQYRRVCVRVTVRLTDWLRLVDDRVQ